MQFLFDKDLSFYDGSEKLPLKCKYCNNTFYRSCNEIKRELKRKNNLNFCNRDCFHKAKTQSVESKCGNCGIKILRKPSQRKISKSGNSFCSKHCAVTFNNKHKTKGTRRSKFEVWIEKQLTNDYPELEIDFNKTNAINSELDVYFPKLRFGIELNGIFHYEPIFGKDKLTSIQNNDERKFQACIENNIELMIIDISSIKYFKPEKATKYYIMIKDILSKKLCNYLV